MSESAMPLQDQPSLELSVGQGRTSTITRRAHLEPSGESLSKLLSDLPPVREGWLSMHSWSTGRSAGDWLAACGVVVDLDHHIPDPIGEKKGGIKAQVPTEWRERLISMIASGSLPGTIFHHTAYGERIYFLFAERVTDRALYAAAYAGAAQLVESALRIAQVPLGQFVGYEIDPSVNDLGQWFWSPRATVDGVKRDATPVVLRAEPYSAADLAAAAPKAAGPARQRRPRAARLFPTHRAAREAFNTDNAEDWRERKRTCPACGHDGCFGPLPEQPGRWYCFSANHVDGVGQRGEQGWWGDALDLAAYAAGRSTTEHLRATGYLRSLSRTDTDREYGPNPAAGPEEPPLPDEEYPSGPEHGNPPEWPEPLSLERRPELPAFPLDVLPPWMHRHVEAVAAATETDPAMTAIWDLTAESIACGKRFVIERGRGRSVHANLWTLTLLGSGGGKSPTLRASKEPLTAWELRQAGALQIKIAAEATEERVLRRRLEWLQRQAAQAKEPDNRTAAKLEAEDIAGKLSTWKRIVAPVLSVQSGTVARLQELLHEQGGRFALLSDEASAIEDLARFEQRNAPDLSSLNQAYDGDDLRVARKKRDDGSGGDRNIPRAVLSLGLSMQPGRAIDQLRGARAFFDSGFMQRFLVVFPKDLLGQRTHEAPPIPDAVRAEYAAALDELLQLEPVDDAADFPCVALGAEARDELARWQKSTEAQWKPGADDPLRGWGSKLGDKLVRIAGLFHAAHYRRMPWCTEVTAETMVRALSLADFFVAHYNALLFDARVDPVSVLALKTLAWVREGRRGSFKKSELHAGVAKWEGKGAAALLTEALKLLSETFHIRRTARVLTGGRPGEAYEVNPAVLR